MRITPWCVLLAAAPAAAQGTPVTFEEPQPVTISGFAVGSASWDRGPRRAAFEGGKLALSLFKPAGDVYFFGQLTTALEGGTSSTEIDNLIVSWTPSGADRWTLAAGRFDAPVGYERDDEPLNLIGTNSFTFTYARPVKLTGAIARFTATPRLELDAGLANGFTSTADDRWADATDVGLSKTGFVRVQTLPASGVALGVAGLVGPATDSAGAARQRRLVSADLVLDRGPVILGAEADAGAERRGGTNAAWLGVSATGFWRFARQLGLAARYDRMDDADGALFGRALVLESVTVGPMWFYRSAQEGIFSNIEHTRFHLPQVAVRAALRLDRASVPFFVDATGAAQRTDTRALVEIIYLF